MPVDGDLLLGAQVTVGDDSVNLAFDTERQPTGETVLYVVTADERQMGLKSIGSEIVRFVFDFNSAEQTNLDSAYSIGSERATLTVPASAIPGLPDEFDFTAALNVNGSDIAQCAGTVAP